MLKILITGGAGFIGSNLVDHFLDKGHEIVCLDNLSTGFKRNIESHFNNDRFTFIEGDIRDSQACQQSIKGCEFVLHQAALGSVPRSILDPKSTNEVNITGFLNLLVAARDEKISRFVYAASSSTYGDSKKLPKVEEEIGRPLSPYAITKYVNELYAEVFARTYKMQCIGLRYFNVFGQRQDPDGAYAAVIPLWVKNLINLKPPLINGDGSYSRDFTYINNVIQANEKALFQTDTAIVKGKKEYYNIELEQNKYPTQDVKSKSAETEVTGIFSEIFNIANGGNTTLLQLFKALRTNLAVYQKNISEVEPTFGPVRPGDIPHSQASILKAQTILGYEPRYDSDLGLKEAAKWYYQNIKRG